MKPSLDPMGDGLGATGNARAQSDDSALRRSRGGEASSRPGNVDIQAELNRLEELILDSPRFFRRTLVDEEQFLEQLDLVRLSLPEAFQEAQELVRHKEEMLLQAEQYAQDIIDQAERRATQILNELGIVRQAEMEAQQVRQRMQQDCDAAKDQTIAEIDQIRQRAQQEVDALKQQAFQECEEIQNGADDYADRVLTDLETRLADMLRVIRNGRQQLQPEVESPPPPAQPRAIAPSTQNNRPQGRSDRTR